LRHAMGLRGQHILCDGISNIAALYRFRHVPGAWGIVSHWVVSVSLGSAVIIKVIISAGYLISFEISEPLGLNIIQSFFLSMAV